MSYKSSLVKKVRKHRIHEMSININEFHQNNLMELKNNAQILSRYERLVHGLIKLDGPWKLNLYKMIDGAKSLVVKTKDLSDEEFEFHIKQEFSI